MKPAVIIISSFLLVAQSHAASFDCAKASTKVEHLVCSDPELSALDDTLSRTFYHALRQSDHAEKSRLRENERLWMADDRNVCKDARCVALAYRARISEIEMFHPTHPPLYRRKSAKQLAACSMVVDAANHGSLDPYTVPNADLAHLDINGDGVPEQLSINESGGTEEQYEELDVRDRNGKPITLGTDENDDWDNSTNLGQASNISILKLGNAYYILGSNDAQPAYLAQVDRKNTENVLCEFGQRQTTGSAVYYVLSDYERLLKDAAAQWQDPWIYALSAKGTYRARVLLDARHGFHMQGGTTNLDSAVHTAIQMKRDDALQLMLENGANPNAPDDSLNMTPIYFARSVGNKGAVALLVKHGADPAYRQYTGPKPTQAHLEPQKSLLLFAGANGEPGTADGPALSARFKSPGGLTLLHGNLYVTDCGNRTVRKIDLSTGKVTTVAGSAGKSGVADGVGAEARFTGLRDITTDGKNLYVLDWDAVRMIALPSYKVTTLAGVPNLRGIVNGPGAEARFNMPMGIATDGKSIFVTDLYGMIRRISISTGEATMYLQVDPNASSPDGHVVPLFSPFGIVSDGANLYVLDDYRGNVHKIVIATKEESMLAGPDAAVCAASYEGRCPVGGTVDGRGSAVRFYQPLEVALSGNMLYVADKRSVRRIALPAGDVTTLPGHFMYTGGIAADDHYIYVTDADVHAIYRIPRQGGMASPSASHSPAQ